MEKTHDRKIKEKLMNAHDLAKLLLNGPNITVMFEDPNSGGGPFSVSEAKNIEVKSNDEYPKYFKMRKGFKYICLKN